MAYEKEIQKVLDMNGKIEFGKWIDHSFVYEDFEAIVRTRIDKEYNNYADFEVHIAEFIEENKDGKKAYFPKYDDGLRTTENIDESCPTIKGTVKWDGCVDVSFGSAKKKKDMLKGWVHFCCVHQVIHFGECLKYAYVACQSLIERKDEQ
jgi:hypothetical protein